MKPDIVLALESASWPALIMSDSATVHRANAVALNLFGLPSDSGKASGQAFWSSDNGSSLEAFLAKLDRAPAESLPLKFRTKTGQTSLFYVSGSTFVSEGQKLHLLQLFKNPPASSGGPVSGQPASNPSATKPEGTALENSLAHKQKLECALQLTRTVALDFNNALTSILGHASLLLAKMEPNHPWRSSLVEIEKSAEKAAEVASDLAAFSRQEQDAHAQVAGNLNDLLRRTVELFQAPGSRPFSWTVQLEPKLYTVTFEEAKLQQAFAKILDNAVQALPDNGRISVRTRNQDVAQTIQDENIRLAAGSYVCVEFEDAGRGISPEVLPRIFEPFFTTKKSPNHRGLGLAWVYGIVTNHGGSVAVSSQVNRGTSVRVYLPAQKKIVHDHVLQTGDLSGTQTILMIDDEELLLTMGEMVLSSFGYRVLTAQSGQQALELVTANPGQIDLVITDLVMPKMSGRELVEQLRLIRPDLKIICSSGYIRPLQGEGEDMYLQKPFTSLDLLRKVKQALTHAELESGNS